MSAPRSSRTRQPQAPFLHRLACYMITSAAHFAESECEISLSEYADFVLSVEGAKIDSATMPSSDPQLGALHIKEPDEMSATSSPHDVERSDGITRDEMRTERLMTMRDVYGLSEVLVGHDIKISHARMRKASDGGMYFHGVGWYAAQEDCAALIVYNPQAPHLVACIPKQWVGGPEGEFQSLDHPLTSSQLSPFAMEWSPFVVPCTELASSLKALRQWTIGEVESWQNPSNGLIYRKLERPSLLPLSSLFPHEESLLHDFDILKAIWRSLKGCSESIALILPSLQPNVGDCILFDRSTGQPYSLEIKRFGHLSSNVAAGTIRLMTQSGSGDAFYTPWAAWDLVYVSCPYDCTDYMFAGDELPTELFNCRDTLDSFLWAAGTDLLQQRRLPALGDAAYGTSFTKIIHALRTTGKIPARRTLPLSPAWLSYVFDGRASLVSNTTGAAQIPRTTNSTGRIRGDGKQWSRILWEADFETTLETQCEKIGYGRFFRLGTNSAGCYVFADCARDTGTTSSFFDLSLCTPMLFFNFAQIQMDGRRHAYDLGRASAFCHATHGSHNSFYILQAQCPPGQPQSRNVYLVPSSTIATEQRRDLSHTHLLPGRHEANVYPLVLSQGEPVDAYRVAQEEIVLAIRRVMRLCASSLNVQIGEGITISSSLYLANRRTALEKQLDYHTQDTFFDGSLTEGSHRSRRAARASEV